MSLIAAKNIRWVLTALALVALATAAAAQEAQAPPPAETPAEAAAAPPPPAAGAGETPEAAADKPAVAVSTEINPNDIGPIVFTYWERIAISDARKSRGFSRPPTEQELMEDLAPMDRIKPPPEEREIALGGILYVSGADWTIWLNGKRVTPTAIPKEIIDLKVHEEYVEMKWFDYYSNKVFPLRLRPHQRFNIDTRVFLPG